MTPLIVDIPHKLGAAEAKRRLETGAGSFTNFLPAGSTVQQSWAGDTLNLMMAAFGQEVRAGIEVQQALVRVSLVLPPALGFLRQAIEAGIRQGGTELLDDKRR
jgi:Putative polyhydroxyalkanoic acid system protein (PHA_gran_rgn)